MGLTHTMGLLLWDLTHPLYKPTPINPQLLIFPACFTLVNAPDHPFSSNSSTVPAEFQHQVEQENTSNYAVSLELFKYSTRSGTVLE